MRNDDSHLGSAYSGSRRAGEMSVAEIGPTSFRDSSNKQIYMHPILVRSIYSVACGDMHISIGTG